MGAKRLLLLLLLPGSCPPPWLPSMAVVAATLEEQPEAWGIPDTYGGVLRGLEWNGRD